MSCTPLKIAKLTARAHVDLELSDAVHDVVVDTLAVLAVRFTAGLPVALENVVRIAGKSRELGRVRARREKRRRTHTGQKPG